MLDKVKIKIKRTLTESPGLFLTKFKLYVDGDSKDVDEIIYAVCEVIKNKETRKKEK